MAKTIDVILSLTDKLTAPLGKAGKALSAHSKEFQRAGKSIQKVGNAISGAGKGMTSKLTAPIAAAGAGAVKLAADFEKGMSNVQSISGASGKQLDKLSAKAKEMGAKTKFSAKEATEAYQYMAMAGWKTGSMMEGIEPIMKLAGAANEDLATTSDIVTDSLTAFKMTAKDAGHFTNVMAAASANSNTNVRMLGESFKYCAPLAGSLKFNVNDVSKGLGLMANSGIKASQAGTSMRALFTRMAKPTKASQAAMDALGISLTRSDGKMRSFEGILKKMRKSFNGLTEEEQTQYAAMLAGQNGMSGLLAMVNASEKDFKSLSKAIDSSDGVGKKMNKTVTSMKGLLSDMEKPSKKTAAAMEALGINTKKSDGKTKPLGTTLKELRGTFKGLSKEEQKQYAAALAGEKGMSALLATVNASDKKFKKLSEAVDGSSGACNKMYKVSQDNLNGQLTTLKSTVESIGISFGERLTPYVKKATVFIQGIADKFNGLSKKQQDAIIKNALMAASIGPGLIAFGKLTSSIGGVVRGIGNFGGKLPQMSKNAKDAFNILKSIHVAPPKGLSKVGNAIGKVGGRAAGLKKPFGVLGNLLKGLGGKCSFLFTPFKGLFGIFGKFSGKLFAPFTKLGSVFGTVGKAAFTFLGPAGSVVAILGAIAIGGVLVYKNWDKIKKMAGKLGNTIKSAFTHSGLDIKAFQKSVGGLGKKVMSLGGKFGECFGGMKKSLGPFLKWFGGTFFKGLQVYFSGIVGFASGLLKGVVNVAGGLLDALGGVIDFVTGIFTGNWEKAWTGIKEIFGGVFTALVGLVKTPFNAVIGLVNGVVNGINKALGGIKIPDWVPKFGGKNFGLKIPTIPMLATGGTIKYSGIAIVGENGPELVNLPKGAQVVSNSATKDILSKRKSTSKGGIVINIAKLADSIVVREDKDIDRIVEGIADKLVKRAKNIGGGDLDEDLAEVG